MSIKKPSKILQSNNSKNNQYVFDEQPQVHTFNNGLRLVYKQSWGKQTTQCGFVINVGARDDGAYPGLAHCFEHMLFKGTKTRSATQVLNRLEVVGGELNAFTGKDVTVVYANVLSLDFKRATDLLADIIFNSTFKEAELQKEKRVIKEEINLYLDTPEENIFDEFQKHHYPLHPMGYNILGDEESLKKIDSQVMQSLWKQYYNPDNMVFSVVSNLPFEKVIKTCQFLEHFKANPLVCQKG